MRETDRQTETDRQNAIKTKTNYSHERTNKQKKKQKNKKGGRELSTTFCTMHAPLNVQKSIPRSTI